MKVILSEELYRSGRGRELHGLSRAHSDPRTIVHPGTERMLTVRLLPQQARVVQDNLL